MGSYQIIRYAIKDDDQTFVDPATYTESEQLIANTYIAYVKSLPGHKTDVVRTQIDSNTIKYVYECESRDGAEEVTARAFFRGLTVSSNTARTDFLDMLKNKGNGTNPAKSYTEVVFANNHTIRLANI